MVQERDTLSLSVFMMAALFACSSPWLFSNSQTIEAGPQTFPGWPTEYEKRSLKELPLTEKERLFARDFPGKIGRFTDGSREIIIRWLKASTRRLHPARDCFRGIGYQITPLPVQTNEVGVRMGCFSATNQSQSLSVCEYIKDLEGHSWSDVSSWYWHALFTTNTAGWWSYVVAESS